MKRRTFLLLQRPLYATPTRLALPFKQTTCLNMHMFLYVTPFVPHSSRSVFFTGHFAVQRIFLTQ